MRSLLGLAGSIYVLESSGTTIRVWHAPAIPPVFAGGGVRVETHAANTGATVTVTMKEYTGKLLGG